MKLSADVDRLTAHDLKGERRAETIAQLTGKYQLAPITLHDTEKKISRNETTVARHAHFGDGTVQVPGLRVTVEIPFEGSSRLWWLRPSSYRISGAPVASVHNGVLTLGEEFTGPPDTEQVRAWYQREIESVRWYLGKIEEEVNGHNVGIERTLPDLIEKRVSKLDALRKFDADLDLDGGATGIV